MAESKSERPEPKNKEGAAETESRREETIEWVFTVNAKTGEVVKIEHTVPGQAQRKEVTLADYTGAVAKQAVEQAQQAHEQAQQQYASMGYGFDPYSQGYGYSYYPYEYSPYGYNPYGY